MLSRRLQAVLDEAAAAAPAVFAAVLAPGQGLDWAGVAGAGAADPDTPFRIASVTKLFTAAALMRLVEQGGIGLESSLGTLAGDETLRALHAAGYVGEHITPSQLLTHCSGLPDHAGSSDFTQAVRNQPQRRWTRHEQIGHAMRMGPPLAAPGAQFHYADTGYVILGEVIERATGLPLAAAVRRLLALDARGLRDTWWEQLEPAPAHARALAAQFIGDVDVSTFDASFDLFGGGGIVSTVRDLVRFNRALVRGELFERRATLAAALVVPAALRPAGARMHARVGYVVPMGAERRGWGHTGFWGSVVATCPERDITVALTFNQAQAADATRVLRTLADLVTAASAR